jgi:hypothetical protein
MKVETRILIVDWVVELRNDCWRPQAIIARGGRVVDVYSRELSRAGSLVRKGYAGASGESLNALLYWLTRPDIGLTVGMEVIHGGVDWVIVRWLVYPLTFSMTMNVGRTVNKGRSCVSTGARQILLENPGLNQGIFRFVQYSDLALSLQGIQIGLRS